MNSSHIPTAQNRNLVAASVISRIFDPFIVFSVTVLIALFRSTLSGSARLLFVLILVLIVIAPPFVLLSWAVARKKVSDWDISKRQERPLALFILLVLSVIDLYIVHVYGDTFLFGVFSAFLVWLTGFLVITVFWKISGHTGVISLFAAIAFHWFGIRTLPVFFLIPVVAWARVVRHDHTVAQTCAGALYSFAIVTVLVLLGYV